MKNHNNKNHTCKKAEAPHPKGGRIFCHLTISVVIIHFILILISTNLFADDISSFNDSRWNWMDADYTQGTSYTVSSDTSMSIAASGKVWSPSDRYAAYYLEDINGDFTATVKIISQGNTNTWAKAGIMVRNDISQYDGNGSGYTLIAVTPGNRAVFQWDANADGRSDNYDTENATLPYWLKMEKSGNTYTGSYSYDGSTWVEVHSYTFSSTVATTQDVGIFVTSGNTYNKSTVVFNNFSINSTPIIPTYTLSSSAGDNGEISPVGTVTVSEGTNKTYTAIPLTGYQVASLTDNGDAVTLTDNAYTLSNIIANHTIVATFSPLIYAIESTSGDGGSISPSGVTNVLYGQSQTYEVTPDEGYQVEAVTVDGSSAELINDEYTFSNVVATHTIHVTFTAIPTPPPATPAIAGCSTNSSTDYSSGFNASDFDLNNMTVDENGAIILSTGADAINPESIVIPFEQEISVSFLYEGAGYVSSFGWMLKSDAVVDANGIIKWQDTPKSVKHSVFRNINDDVEGWGGNGVFDSSYGNGSFPSNNEASLAVYNDGTEYKFTVDGDGVVTPKDMKKTLGTFAAGSEIIFFLASDQDWYPLNPSPPNPEPNISSYVYYTKKDWNPDVYDSCTPSINPSAPFTKTYYLGTASPESSCTTNAIGWLTLSAITRMNSVFGVSLSGSYNLPLTYDQKYAHVIVGAPDNDPDQWILGWEDLDGGGDVDHNDMVFKVNRKTGGVAELKSTEAIVPAEDSAYYTAVTFEVWDSMPCSGSAEINYFVSIDNGSNWVEITEWDKVNESSESKTIGTEVTNWTPGDPQYTYRSRRIDFAERDLYGRAIIWKAVMTSEDPACIPQILDVAIEGDVSSNGSFSRGEPVVVANVIYSGSYETPSLSWTEKVQRGHLHATRLYLPQDTTSTDTQILWDAGAVLSNTSPASRSIYFPNITTASVSNEVIATGDGATVTFSGTLAHHVVSATTLVITDQTETFRDKHTDELKGSKEGTGTINRFTGEYTLTFDSPPGENVPVKASYTYYTTSNTLRAFNTTNINSGMLALDDTYLIGSGFTYDFNGDGKYNGVDPNGTGTPDDSDGDWLVQWIRGYSDGSSTAKSWLLGPIDHSVPALATPPGKPAWYFGTDIPESEKSSYDTFRAANYARQTVAYIGSRDGMLHAFNAGKFRWGDNPETSSTHENRGYFLWESGIPNYGSGAELWAFIPANLIPRLKNNKLSGEDRAFVDASPALADVYVDINDGNGTKWRTILMCAEGNGGDTVFALDVTNPYSPFFLWEFADPDLFRSRSSPAVAQIGRIMIHGTAKWVAFFVSGKSYDNTLYPSIYMIDVSNGSVLQRIYLDVESSGIGGIPSGQPAIIDSDGNGYIDRLYVGTDKGYMYKVNLPDDPDGMNYQISHCIINSDFTDENGDSVPSSQQYHPIYASPAVIVDRDYSTSGVVSSSVKIFFGTGDSPYYDEDINTASTTYHFFTYIDETEKGNNDPDAVKLDWFYELPAGHRVFASAFAAAGTIYFGTATSETEDPCSSSNEGKLIALNIDDGTLIHSEDTGNIYSTPIVDDKHVYFKTPNGLTSLGGDDYNNAVTVDGTTVVSTKMWREGFEEN